MPNLENQKTVKTESFQKNKQFIKKTVTSTRQPASTSQAMRYTASLILGAFFLNTIQPVKLAKAEEYQGQDFKAPQTVNIPTEETNSFNGYHNEVDRYQSVIPEEAKTSTINKVVNNTNQTIQKGIPTTIDTTVPVAISDLMKSYQQKILLAVNLKNNRESTLKTILAKAYPTIQEAVQNAYASQPFTTNSVMALFNNTNYLDLRRQAEDKKKKDEEKAKNRLVKENTKLKDNLVKFLKTIKEKFRKQKLATLNRLTNLKNSQEQNINNLTNQIKSIPQKIASLKQQLQAKLNSITYLRNKENEYRGKYKHYDKERKHNKDKYKKYKKKYKKKHKSKYKKRYKKYKKRYKSARDKRDRARKTYNKYEAQKNQAYQEYLNLQQQIQAYNNKQTILTEQMSLVRKENEKIKEELDTQTKEINQELEESIDNDKDYQAETGQALANFNTSKRKLEDDYLNELNQAETTYQSNLEKAEVYKDTINMIEEITEYQVEETIAMGQERVRFEIALRKYIKEETAKQKQLAEKRVEDRNSLAQQIAGTVFAGMIKGPKNLLNAFNDKLAKLKKELKKIGKKVKDLKEIYKETKNYKKKMKEYKKKYEKYSKKVKKYKGKSGKKNRKKYKKYKNKKSSALKKYLKYKKKYEKYNGLKKAYKSGYKQAKEVYHQFKDQYQDLESQRNDLQTSYNQSVAQATKFKNQILNQAQKEYKVSQSQLQLAETMEDFSLIGLDNKGEDKNEDLKSYLTLIPAGVSEAGPLERSGSAVKGLASSERDFLNFLASLNFQGGLDAVNGIKKSFKKLRHKAKKAYKKALEKQRKENARLEAERQRKINAYYAQQRAKKRAWEEEQRKQAEIQRQNTHYDQYGNGYSSQYNTYYSDRINPSNTITKDSWFGYGQSTSSKFSWKSLFGATASASTTTSTYKPKKSWWGRAKEIVGKVKDWGKNLIFKTKDSAQNATHSFWEKTKEAWNKTEVWDKTKEAVIDTAEVVKNGFGDTVDRLVKNGKGWYNEIKENVLWRDDSWYNKTNKWLDNTSDALGITALISGIIAGIASDGLLAAPAAGLVGIIDVITAPLDAISAGMYSLKGQWKDAGRKALAITPYIGGLVSRALKLGKPTTTVLKEYLPEM
jgi:hypothetical protein